MRRTERVKRSSIPPKKANEQQQEPLWWPGNRDATFATPGLEKAL
jgi:hypothetical protein